MDSPKDINNGFIASEIPFVRMTCYFFFFYIPIYPTVISSVYIE